MRHQTPYLSSIELNILKEGNHNHSFLSFFKHSAHINRHNKFCPMNSGSCSQSIMKSFQGLSTYQLPGNPLPMACTSDVCYTLEKESTKDSMHSPQCIFQDGARIQKRQGALFHKGTFCTQTESRFPVIVSPTQTICTKIFKQRANHAFVSPT